jgi:hypothetical protein
MSGAWRLPAAVVGSALAAVVLREPVVPVPARLLVLAHLPVPPPLLQEREFQALVPLVPADLVVEPAAAVERLHLLLSRQSFSAAMARSSP